LKQTQASIEVEYLQHFQQWWNEGGFVAILVDQDAAEVQTAGVMVQLVDLNYLQSTAATISK